MKTWVDGHRPCSSARVEKPSRTGIIRSSTTMSGWSVSATRTHSSPSLATTTSAPCCWNALRYSRRMSDSSSQIRTLTAATVRKVRFCGYGPDGLVSARPSPRRGLLGGPATGTLAVLLHRVDGPEVLGQLGAGDVGVGHRVIALLAPVPAPRVAHGKALSGVVVADGHHRVPAHLLLLGPGHVH